MRQPLVRSSFLFTCSMSLSARPKRGRSFPPFRLLFRRSQHFSTHRALEEGSARPPAPESTEADGAHTHTHTPEPSEQGARRGEKKVLTRETNNRYVNIFIVRVFGASGRDSMGFSAGDSRRHCTRASSEQVGRAIMQIALVLRGPIE